jgi:hypothetical protein
MTNVGFYEDGTPISGADTIEEIKKKTDTILVFFSCGKDSIALWLKLRSHFKIIPIYMWLVPDLEFVEDSIVYYEEWFDTPIVRVPHPSFYRMLGNMVYQPPERVSTLLSVEFPNFTYDHLSTFIGQDAGLEDIWTATGIRAADSPNRRSSINQHGPINWTRNYFYPVWDMRIAELEQLLIDEGVALPVDYELFGRSFDGIDHRFCHLIKERFPADYEIIKFWVPFVELELMRYEI